MGLLGQLYGRNLTLLTDLYELTMAYGYWKSNKAQDEAVFHLFFRDQPFHSGYAIAAGLEQVIEYLQHLRFEPQDLTYLASLTGSDHKPLLEQGFLDYLAELQLTCDVDAIPEGTVVFGHEPLVRVSGPIWQAQIIESILLTLVNYQTLIATKAARVCQAARGQSVLEFGLRRAQGVDGSITAARAAYIGGCTGTSNVLAGQLLGIPVKGTHAHSWVMSFDSELESFEAYARAMPNNCLFLVDTYDTLQGVRRAVEVGQKLRALGHELAGIRLDSGDLAYLSIEARKILDAGGFPSAVIVASNDLDEQIIDSLKQQGATISVWGVGTRLVTAYDQPALGGVYKLGAYRKQGDPAWQPRIKLSEHMSKTSVPGILQTRRYHDDYLIADMIYETSQVGLPSDTQDTTIVDPKDPLRRKRIAPGTRHEDLLVPIFRAGRLVYTPPSLPAIRARVQTQLKLLHPTIKRFINPHEYPVGLESHLDTLRTQLVMQDRNP